MSLRCEFWSTCRKTETFPAVSSNAVRWCLIQIFAGGHNWAKNLALAKTLVTVRGGSEILLSRSATDEAGLGTSSGVFRAKLMLGTLAVYDIFGGYAHRKGGHIHPRSYLAPGHGYFTPGVIADDPVFFSTSRQRAYQLVPSQSS